MRTSSPTISELQAVRCSENGEPLLDVATVCNDILCDYRRGDSDVKAVLVRKSVVDRLQAVQEELTKHDSGMKLLVVEGYRSPLYQERYFLEQLVEEYRKDSTRDFSILLEHVHQFVALPSVAGHPTGGAIDLTITYEGQEIDMGGAIADFSNPDLLPTRSPLANPEQAKHRMLLQDLMVQHGFAPFFGEWWHFSYGDREWAAFYAMPQAHYSPIY